MEGNTGCPGVSMTTPVRVHGPEKSLSKKLVGNGGGPGKRTVKRTLSRAYRAKGAGGAVTGVQGKGGSVKARLKNVKRTKRPVQFFQHYSEIAE